MKFLNDSELFSLSNPRELVEALRSDFSRFQCIPNRTHHDLPGGDDAKLLLMPAWRDREFLGVKVATVMPDNSRRDRPTIDGLYILLDGQTGEPQAVLCARALTALRTAAVSALAASYLARLEARTLLLVGTGALAPHMARAHLAMRPIDKLMVWGRNQARASEIVRDLGDWVGQAEVTSDLEHATRQADIVCCATSATQPLLEAEWISPGTHVDLVGSFTPAMQEIDCKLFERARLLVDTLAGFDESGDLIAAAQHRFAKPASTPTLTDLVRGSCAGRTTTDEITIFKAVGTGIADLAVAVHLSFAARGNPTGV